MSFIHALRSSSCTQRNEEEKHLLATFVGTIGQAVPVALDVGKSEDGGRFGWMDMRVGYCGQLGGYTSST